MKLLALVYDYGDDKIGLHKASVQLLAITERYTYCLSYRYI
ncbi:hypothetical protein [Sphingobacterium sp. MYb382]